jgi:glutathione synthase
LAALLFIIDPLDELKPHKDSTVAMMRAAFARGHAIWTATPTDLSIRWSGTAQAAQITASAQAIELNEQAQVTTGQPWFTPAARALLGPTNVHAVVMRKDPPYDVDYHVCTQLLEHFERAGVPVFNRPQALRDHGEKTAVLEFSEFAPEGIVSPSLQEILSFARAYERIVIKPLDAMGGSGIFLSHAQDPNLPVIVETLSLNGTRQIMAQRWLPEIAQGDKRVLLIDGKPFSHCLARIPPEGASRGNLAAGGRGEARTLSARDREIAEALGPVLKARGLMLVGLDIIGDRLTEINVTSPTGFQEIAQQTGLDPSWAWLDALEAGL